MTRILITLPLLNERACTGCPFVAPLNVTYCLAFAMPIDPVPKRLPECIAAELTVLQEVERE